MKFNGNITLNALGQSEVQNLIAERFSATPAFFASEAGRLIYNTTSRLYYMNSGLGWVALATGGDAASLQTEVDALEASIGSVVTSTGAFNPAAFTGANIISASSLTDAINQLDRAVTGKDMLNELVDVAVGSRTAGQFLRYDAAASKWVNHTLVAADLTDVTASATELNFVKGVTSAVQTQITGEVTRATQAEANVQAAVVAEATRADTAEKAIAANLVTETAARTAADTTLTTNLAAEATRATGAEAALTTSIGNEVTRAEAAEAALQTSVSAEVTRAQGAETALSGRVTQEVTDRTAAVNAAATSLASEVTRATGAEGTLTTNLNAEVARAIAAEQQLLANINSKVAGLSWEAPIDAIGTALPATAGLATGYRFFDTTDNKVYTYSGTAFNAGVAQVDGNAFFHKGDDVGYVFNGTALVQFNGAANITAGAGLVKVGNTLSTASTTGTITVSEDSIDVAQSVIDSIAAVQTHLNTENSRATTAESGLGQRVTDETTARIAGDASVTSAFQAADASEATARTAADTKLTNDLATEVTRAEAAETANATAITAEATRATSAEATLTANLASEVTRATAASGVNAAAIVTETTNRTTAVAGVQTAVTNEVSRATAAEAALTAKLGKGYFLYSGAAAQSHTVGHGIGSQFCNVTVIDSATSEQIIPQSVVFDSATSLTVTFNVALACKVVVMGLGV